jgi:aryl-alcohol dehydrogenase-like predicted oxidoreductase
LNALRGLEAIAKELGCSMAQLAMAWVIHNPDVSTAITGVTKVAQIEDTVKAIGVYKKLTPEIERRIEELFNTAPKGKIDMPKRKVHKSRRFKTLGYSPA